MTRTHYPRIESRREIYRGQSRGDEKMKIVRYLICVRYDTYAATSL